MTILLTGATGYIGKRLLPVLLSDGHKVICCVRDKGRFDVSGYNTDMLDVIEVNFLKKESLTVIPESIDAAYYLIHSMSTNSGNFEELERISANNFKDSIERTSTKQVIYLSGIVNDEELSKHLSSRKTVENILSQGVFHLTTLRAGIIVGSGSASFEIIRDLVEKLPVMIAPQWLNTKSQPIALRNVLQFLRGVLMDDRSYDQSYDIGGPEVLTYKQMLHKFARIRKLRRYIGVVPLMTPKLSSYWLYFVTSTSYKLAVNLVNSMKVEVVCKENNLKELVQVELLTYEEAVEQAFGRIEQQEVVSFWGDALHSRILENGIGELVQVPSFGCFKDHKQRKISDENKMVERIWSIGGKNGWYYANWLWVLRGFLDKVAGGAGLRRGRRSNTLLEAGDPLDFWRVILADRDAKRLLLYAEMKLPGEAWLEFRIEDKTVHQIATFRPLGLIGRLYWYSLLVLHAIIFRGMINGIVADNSR